MAPNLFGFPRHPLLADVLLIIVNDLGNALDEGDLGILLSSLKSSV